MSILDVVVVIELVISLVFIVCIGFYSNNKDYTVTEGIKECLFGLYRNRNLFGKLTSTVVAVVLFPGALLLLIVFYLLELIPKCIFYVWSLGNKAK